MDPFARRWLDLLCFCLSGLPADGTVTAEMAMMFGERLALSGSKSCSESRLEVLQAHGGDGLSCGWRHVATNARLQELI